MRCVALMCECILQTFGGSAVFTAKVVAAFKTETRRGWKKDLTTWTHERNGVNLTLTFTIPTGDITGIGSCAKKNLRKT